MQNIWLGDIKKYIPDITQEKARLISSNWREFWDHPDRYKNTDLPQIISDWVNEEIKHWHYDEYYDWRRDKDI